MGFLEGDGGARAQGDDVDVQVVAQVVGGDEAVVVQAPSVPGMGTGVAAVSWVTKAGAPRGRARGCRPCGSSGSGPGRVRRCAGSRWCGGQVGVGAGGEGVGLSVADEAGLARDEEEHGLGLGVGLGPLAAAAGGEGDEVLGEGLGEPERGRASIQTWAWSQKGSAEVTMSLITPRGMTA